MANDRKHMAVVEPTGTGAAIHGADETLGCRPKTVGLRRRPAVFAARPGPTPRPRAVSGASPGDEIPEAKRRSKTWPARMHPSPALPVKGREQESGGHGRRALPPRSIAPRRRWRDIRVANMAWPFTDGFCPQMTQMDTDEQRIHPSSFHLHPFGVSVFLFRSGQVQTRPTGDRPDGRQEPLAAGMLLVRLTYPGDLCLQGI